MFDKIMRILFHIAIGSSKGYTPAKAIKINKALNQAYYGSHYDHPRSRTRRDAYVTTPLKRSSQPEQMRNKEEIKAADDTMVLKALSKYGIAGDKLKKLVDEGRIKIDGKPLTL